MTKLLAMIGKALLEGLFFTMWFLVILLIWGQFKDEPTVNWVGCPVYGEADGSDRWTLISHQIGLRSDGVVVWKRKEDRK
jgi:hypothetical protein